MIHAAVLTMAGLIAGATPPQSSKATISEFSVDLPVGWSRGAAETLVAKPALEREGLRYLAAYSFGKRALGSAAYVVFAVSDKLRVSDAEARGYLVTRPQALAQQLANAFSEGDLPTRAVSVAFDPSRFSFWTVFEPNASGFCGMAQFMTEKGQLFMHAYSGDCREYLPAFESIWRATTIPTEKMHAILRTNRQKLEPTGRFEVRVAAGPSDQSRLQVEAQVERKKREGLSEVEAARWVLSASHGLYLLEVENGHGANLEGVIDEIAAAEGAYLDACRKCAPVRLCNRDRVGLLLGRRSEAAPCASPSKK